jgi:hypothetical protein
MEVNQRYNFSCPCGYKYNQPVSNQLAREQKVPLIVKLHLKLCKFNDLISLTTLTEIKRCTNTNYVSKKTTAKFEL